MKKLIVVLLCVAVSGCSMYGKMMGAPKLTEAERRERAFAIGDFRIDMRECNMIANGVGAISKRTLTSNAFNDKSVSHLAPQQTHEGYRSDTDACLRDRGYEKGGHGAWQRIDAPHICLRKSGLC